MKLSHAALLTGLTTALLFGTGPDVSAQFNLGVQGTMQDISSIDFGLGGRLGYFQETSSFGVGVEATYNYYFPSCVTADCDSSGGHVALLGTQSGQFWGESQTYFGAGARYQRLAFNTTDATDYWGFIVLLGTRVRSQDRFAPFFEIGWSFMGDISDIFDLTLGVRYQLGS